MSCLGIRRSFHLKKESLFQTSVYALQTRISIIILMIFQYHKHIIVKENEYNDCVPFRTFSPLTMTISFYLSIILCCESCVTLYLTFKKSDRYKCYIRCHNVVFLCPECLIIDNV